MVGINRGANQGMKRGNGLSRPMQQMTGGNGHKTPTQARKGIDGRRTPTQEAKRDSGIETQARSPAHGETGLRTQAGNAIIVKHRSKHHPLEAKASPNQRTRGGSNVAAEAGTQPHGELRHHSPQKANGKVLGNQDDESLGAAIQPFWLLRRTDGCPEQKVSASYDGWRFQYT